MIELSAHKIERVPTHESDKPGAIFEIWVKILLFFLNYFEKSIQEKEKEKKMTVRVLRNKYSVSFHCKSCAGTPCVPPIQSNVHSLPTRLSLY